MKSSQVEKSESFNRPESLLGYQTNVWFGQPILTSSPSARRKLHPQTTPPEVAEKVIEIALKHPTMGCCKLVDELKHHNILLSSPTVQKILIKQQLGSRRERAARVLELRQGDPRLPLIKR